MCEHHLKMTVRGGWMCMNCPATEGLSHSDKVNLNAIKDEIPATRKHLLVGTDLMAHLETASRIVNSWPTWKRGLLDNSPTRSPPRKPV